MSSRNKSASLKAFTAIMLCTMITSTSIFGEEEEVKLNQQLTPITCKSIILGKNYSFQLKADSLDEFDHWEYVSGDMPNGIILDSSGKLSGKLEEIPGMLDKKTFNFLVKVQDKDDTSKAYIFEVHMKAEKNEMGWTEDEQLRLIAGYEMIRPSGDKSVGNGFLDVYLSQQFPGIRDKTGKRLTLWGNIRFTSLPVKSTAKLNDIKTQDYNQELVSSKLEEIAQAGEFLVGFEYLLGEGQRYRLGFILSAGVLAPIGSAEDAKVIYNIPEDCRAHYGGKQYLSIEIPKYNRFYLQYYAGFRLKTFKEMGNDFPSLLDVMFGVNQANSGGETKFLKNTAIRIDGFLPIQIKNFTLYIFGSLVKNATKRSLVINLHEGMDAVDQSATTISPSDVCTQRLHENRDYYRIGIGVDFSKSF